MKPSIEALEAIKVLIGDPKHWTKGAMARDAVGSVQGSYAPQACKWCLEGALNKTVDDLNRKRTARDYDMMLLSTRYAIQKAIAVYDLGWVCAPEGISIVSWNDRLSRTHDQVMAMLDKAIQMETNQ